MSKLIEIKKGSEVSLRTIKHYYRLFTEKRDNGEPLFPAFTVSFWKFFWLTFFNKWNVYTIPGDKLVPKAVFIYSIDKNTRTFELLHFYIINSKEILRSIEIEFDMYFKKATIIRCDRIISELSETNKNLINNLIKYLGFRLDESFTAFHLKSKRKVLLVKELI